MMITSYYKLITCCYHYFRQNSPFVEAMGVILNSYGRKLPFNELMALIIDNMKKETPVCLTNNDGTTITFRNVLYYKQNFTKQLHMFDPEEDDPEFRAFKPPKSALQQLNPFNLAQKSGYSKTPNHRPGCDLAKILTRKYEPKLERDDIDASFPHL